MGFRTHPHSSWPRWRERMDGASCDAHAVHDLEGRKTAASWRKQSAQRGGCAALPTHGLAGDHGVRPVLDVVQHSDLAARVPALSLRTLLAPRSGRPSSELHPAPALCAARARATATRRAQQLASSLSLRPPPRPGSPRPKSAKNNSDEASSTARLVALPPSSTAPRLSAPRERTQQRRGELHSSPRRSPSDLPPAPSLRAARARRTATRRAQQLASSPSLPPRSPLRPSALQEREERRRGELNSSPRRPLSVLAPRPVPSRCNSARNSDEASY